jgi:thioredoxin 1
MITNITNAAQFKTAIREGKVIVDFYADWCGPCKMQAPVLDEFSKKIPQANVLKVNVDTNSDLAEEFGIMSIPTMVVFTDGKATYKKPGFHPMPALEALLK